MSGSTTVPRAAPDPGGPLAAEDLEGLYADHRLGLVRLAALLLDDVEQAADVVQDAFAGLVAAPARVERDRALAYLRAAVVNRSRSNLRRRRTARRHVPPSSVEPGGPAERLVVAEEHREVLDALHALPPRQREVLVLRYWSGLDEAGIAAAMGVSRGTVKSTASRALDALHRRLGGTP